MRVILRIHPRSQIPPRSADVSPEAIVRSESRFCRGVHRSIHIHAQAWGFSPAGDRSVLVGISANPAIGGTFLRAKKAVSELSETAEEIAVYSVQPCGAGETVSVGAEKVSVRV